MAHNYEKSKYRSMETAPAAPEPRIDDASSCSTPAAQQPRVKDIGFSVLHDPDDAIVDVVFIHGLQGHPRKTWTCEKSATTEPQGSRDAVGPPQRKIKELFSRKRKDGAKDAQKLTLNEVFWPLDLLPQDCANARILTWGYDSRVTNFFNGPANQSNIAAHAKNLLHALKVNRLNCQDRSLIFVAHSLGGIIVKDVIRRAATDSDPTILSIYTSTEGILFLGTPHRGSSKAGIGEVVRKIASVSGFDTTDQNLRALNVNSSELEFVHELFMKIYEQRDRKFKVLTFQEAKGVVGVSYLKLNERVVEPFSSSITTTEPIQVINAHHMSMCRFPSSDDEGYIQVSGEILILISGVQKRMEQAMKEYEIALADKKPGPPSQTSTADSAPKSFTDIERKCIALLSQHTTNIAEYKSSLPTPVEGTCHWILSHPQYCNWKLQKDTCLLWISGYPGSGKTILSSYILEYLTPGEHSPSMRTTICYFFCDEKIGTQRDGLMILRSLIHQLLARRRSLVRYVKAAYDYYGPEFDQNFNELWRLFIEITSDRRVGPVSIVIDAIDECEETTRERFLQHIMNLMNRSQSTGLQTPSMKFLVTSRPLLVHQHATNNFQIDLSQENVENDLRLVIQTKIEGIVQRTRCKPEVKLYLEDTLSSRADRTFLWVTLVLRLLEKSLLASQKDFMRIIDKLPRTLTTTYERFLHDISLEYQPLATKLLHLLVASSRPLSLEELRILIAMQSYHSSLAAIEEDAQPNVQATVEGVLGPLIRIWDGRVYLVHQSLKEYLQTLATQRDNPLSAEYGVDPQNASLLLAELCISYLLLDDFKLDLFSPDSPVADDSPISPVAFSPDVGPGEQAFDPYDLGDDILFKHPALREEETCEIIATKYSFFDYSARNWAEHFRFASTISPPELQKSVILLSDACNFRGLNWLRIQWYYSETDVSCPRDFDSFMVACYFGHVTSLKSLFRESLPTGFENGTRGLYWASRMGHREIVDMLLEQKMNPDVKVLGGQSAFLAAVSSDRLDVVKVLLKDDGYIPEHNVYRVNYPALGGRTPLSIAAGNGFTEIVQQLLQHKRILPDLPDFDCWTPLFWSIGGRHLDAVKLLAKDGRSSVNHVDKSGRTALSWAAAAGELEIVKYLMSLKDLKADQPDLKGRTEFSWAAGNGYLKTVMLMRRSQRFNVSKRDDSGRNAISWACSGGQYKLVEYLIKHDPIGVDKEDIDGWTPLAWALFNQSPKTVQVLLESGRVDVNKKDNNGQSALTWAASYGYLDVVKLLLNAKGVDIESKDKFGGSPLSHATRYPDVVKALQEALQMKT